jgi:hypothetical protein
MGFILVVLYSSTGTNLERICGQEGIHVRISEFSDACCCCHLTAVAAKPAAMLHRRAARAKLQKSRKLKKTGVYVNIAKTGTSEVLFVPEYNTWGGGGGSNDPPLPPKRVAGKKLRKKRNISLKCVIFSTDCSQPMGLQSVIKIIGKTPKLFALHSSPFQ